MRHSTRNPRPTHGTTAQHIAQTDRRRREHEARQNRAAGLTPDPQYRPMTEAERAVWDAAVAHSRELQAQADAERARLQASYEDARRAGTIRRPPFPGEAQS